MAYSPGRERYLFQEFKRDPNGAVLRKEECPIGTRPPNNIIWGHRLDDFFWIKRIPGVSCMTTWSRSMIVEYHRAHPDEHPGWLAEEGDLWESVQPRLHKPWPLLKLPKLPKKLNAQRRPPLNAIDEGSDHEDDGSYEVVPDTWDAEDERGPKGFGDPWVSDPAVPKTGTVVEPSAEKGSAQASINPFTLEGIPKLEQFIPEEYFPDYILVHDPADICSGLPRKMSVKPESEDEDDTENDSEGQDQDQDVDMADVGQEKTKPPKKDKPTHPTAAPKRYKRMFPTPDTEFSKDSSMPNVAHVYVTPQGAMGEGHHSYVYRASLRLPHPLSARSPNKHVTTALKVAMPRASARTLLENEAETYNAFPRHMMEDWCGYNLVTPAHGFPVPATAVVPKFYGYYVPDFEVPEPEKKENSKTNGRYDYEGSRHDRADNRPSPILLMEECGTPIQPKNFSLDQKTEIFSLLIRLQLDGVVQNSFFTRNILMQPGPLARPPAERTLKRPSFRVIDFGRAQRWKDMAKEVREDAERSVKREAEKNKEVEAKNEVMGSDRDNGKDKETEADGKKKDDPVEKALDDLGTKWWQIREQEKNLARDELGIEAFGPM